MRSKKFIALFCLVSSFGTLGIANAKGCIKGAIVGGVAGHVAGKHGFIGAAAGCAIGRHQANKKEAEKQKAASERAQSAPAPSQNNNTH